MISDGVGDWYINNILPQNRQLTDFVDSKTVPFAELDDLDALLLCKLVRKPASKARANLSSRLESMLALSNDERSASGTTIENPPNLLGKTSPCLSRLARL
jgi:hypothetical protein